MKSVVVALGGVSTRQTHLSAGREVGFLEIITPFYFVGGAGVSTAEINAAAAILRSMFAATGPIALCFGLSRTYGAVEPSVLDMRYHSNAAKTG